MVLKGFEAYKSSTPSYKLMAETGLIFLEIVVVVHLLVAVLAVIFGSNVSIICGGLKTR